MNNARLPGVVYLCRVGRSLIECAVRSLCRLWRRGQRKDENKPSTPPSTQMPPPIFGLSSKLSDNNNIFMSLTGNLHPTWLTMAHSTQRDASSEKSIKGVDYKRTTKTTRILHATSLVYNLFDFEKSQQQQLVEGKRSFPLLQAGQVRCR